MEQHVPHDQYHIPPRSTRDESKDVSSPRGKVTIILAAYQTAGLRRNILEKIVFSYTSKTKAVLMTDDDLILAPSAIKCMFAHWLEKPLQLVGPYTRSHKYTLDGRISYILDNKLNAHNPYSIVLPRALIFQKNYIKTYCEAPNEVRAYVDLQEAHCDDIAFNLAVRNFTAGLPPLKLKLPPESVTDYSAACNTEAGRSLVGGLGLQKGRGAMRKECLDFLVNEYYSKTSLSHTKSYGLCNDNGISILNLSVNIDWDASTKSETQCNKYASSFNHSPSALARTGQISCKSGFQGFAADKQSWAQIRKSPHENKEPHFIDRWEANGVHKKSSLFWTGNASTFDSQSGIWYVPFSGLYAFTANVRLNNADIGMYNITLSADKINILSAASSNVNVGAPKGHLNLIGTKWLNKGTQVRLQVSSDIDMSFEVDGQSGWSAGLLPSKAFVFINFRDYIYIFNEAQNNVPKSREWVIPLPLKKYSVFHFDDGGMKEFSGSFLLFALVTVKFHTLYPCVIAQLVTEGAKSSSYVFYDTKASTIALITSISLSRLDDIKLVLHVKVPHDVMYLGDRLQATVISAYISAVLHERPKFSKMLSHDVYMNSSASVSLGALKQGFSYTSRARGIYLVCTNAFLTILGLKRGGVRLYITINDVQDFQIGMMTIHSLGPEYLMPSNEMAASLSVAGFMFLDPGDFLHDELRRLWQWSQSCTWGVTSRIKNQG
eukprot:UC4_evm1s639